ncbi:DUF1588 domain-containing protein [Roseiconus lacunae]|uniref:DUF1588 domain-containing protein n=1 Tax=Roseiconus lacunae TaxID=2605694 RepID=A0ABT7PDY9_9BACT|nr:DUF1588 domain-containing protein [Roseiconus lacunae]MDM4014715.1 DUF1588 domain-containing protein [Roseiconus lacunae]
MNRIRSVAVCVLFWGFITGNFGSTIGKAETYTPGIPPFVPGSDLGQQFATKFLSLYCVDCHGEIDPEGGLTLTELGSVDELNADVWRSVWAQVTLREMPPAEGDTPEVVERLKFSEWIVGELQHAMRSKGGFHAHQDPGKANFLDHDLLFGVLPDGIKLRPTSTPARLWRLTPQEHITRLNELINTEPVFDPERPGLRTHGDAVPTNHGGELKLYFGTDRILRWQGGTVAYATSVKSVPAILSSARDHGLKNYPDFYSVNSSEATQIMDLADDLLRYMAFGPLSIANPEQITDDPSTYKIKGDIRGLPTAIVYSTKVVRPITPIHDLLAAQSRDASKVGAAVDYLFEALTFRPPTEQESSQYSGLVNESIDKLGWVDGTVLGLSAIFLDRDALFRPELVRDGEADEFGRVRLQDWELGLALNHALRYIRPDETLRQAILDGRMRTKADVKRELVRMLTTDSIRKPRVLQFFRDYFDYDHAGYLCKDNRALADTGVNTRGTSHYRAMFDASASTDRLVELVLSEDRQVLRRLLTTDQVVATPADGAYFGRRNTNEQRAASVAAAKYAAEQEDRELEAEILAAEKELAELTSQRKSDPDDERLKRSLDRKTKSLEMIKKRAANLKKRRGSINHNITEATLAGPEIFARVSRRSFGNGSMKPERILATVPKEERLGILTHPSWLVSHSDAMDNHAIRRGHWIRERLLGGGIPDVPITVDAMLPDEPKVSLRERMRVTREDYCWTCHKKMDPLGLPFEMYNHAGVYRTEELGRPVNTVGEVIDSGEPELDGEVANAIELIKRLSESERVEQVFVRHAFRFWMGRNETLHDAPILQEAYRAYRDSDGSMNALLISLLTSDAFLYRSRSDVPIDIGR